jgi:hypothetical protein
MAFPVPSLQLRNISLMMLSYRNAKDNGQTENPSRCRGSADFGKTQKRRLPASEKHSPIF